MADDMFGPDGTAAPSPAPLYADPLAGLVGAGTPVAPMEPAEPVARRSGTPVEIDQDRVRADVERALSDDRDDDDRDDDRDPDATERASWQPPSVPGTPPPGAPARTYRQSRQAPRQGRSSTGEKPGNKSPGCVIMVVLIVIVILFNVFSRLGDWISNLFH